MQLNPLIIYFSMITTCSKFNAHKAMQRIHAPGFCAVLIIVDFFLISFADLSVAVAQSMSQFVYQVHAKECSAGQKGRLLTGFREAGRRGIVTALHGVAGCKTITASNAQDNRDLEILKIIEVDVERDLARLSSRPLANGGIEGIPPKPLTLGSPLRVLGYPHGVPSLLVSNLSIREPSQIKLSNLLPLTTPLSEFRERNSPGPNIDVLSIEGHLTVGHSGAPILNGANQLVGVANGGLNMGATEITWAIPYSGQNSFWQPLEGEVKKRVEWLGQRNATLIFAMAEDVPSHPNQSCFGRTVHFIRSVTLSELVSHVDDPATYQALIQMMGLHRANLNYLLYRDLPQVGGAAQPVVTLAVPEAWKLASIGDRCMVTAPQLSRGTSDPPITVEFDLRTLTGSNPSQQIQKIVFEKEVSQFFNGGYIIDEWASNPFPHLMMHQGLIARRKSYVGVERRCGPGPFPTQSQIVRAHLLTPAIWNSWPLVTRDNSSQCIGQGGAIYPDIWVPMMLPRIPQQYIRAVGFGSYMGSEEHVLLNTVKLAEPKLQQGLLECSEQLSRSKDCRHLYARQRQWAAAVIAATVSTLTPSVSVDP